MSVRRCINSLRASLSSFEYIVSCLVLCVFFIVLSFVIVVALRVRIRMINAVSVYVCMLKVMNVISRYS